MSNLRNNSSPRFRRRILHVVNFLGSISLCYIGSLAAAGGASSVALAQQTKGSAAPPVAYASVSEVNNILAQVKQTAAAIEADLDRAHIERWKTDGATKRQTQANVDSIQRNLQSALPEIVTQVNNSPEDMAASFKLYRNLDALYDVFGSVVESAGAFGSKDEFQSLSNDMNGLESERRALGERVQKLAGAKEEELGRLRAEVKKLSAAPPPPPKKIIVDDTEPAPKKPAKKKTTKPGTKTKTPAKPPTAATPSALPSN
ncbi:MAG: hypothetical protein WA172_04605 [Terriglobales bacterium]